MNIFKIFFLTVFLQGFCNIFLKSLIKTFNGNFKIEPRSDYMERIEGGRGGYRDLIFVSQFIIFTPFSVAPPNA